MEDPMCADCEYDAVYRGRLGDAYETPRKEIECIDLTNTSDEEGGTPYVAMPVESKEPEAPRKKRKATVRAIPFPDLEEIARRSELAKELQAEYAAGYFRAYAYNGSHVLCKFADYA